MVKQYHKDNQKRKGHRFHLTPHIILTKVVFKFTNYLEICILCILYSYFSSMPNFISPIYIYIFLPPFIIFYK